MPWPLVVVRDLTVRFGAVEAVVGFDLTLPGRRLGRADRPQRRRQVDHAAGAGRRAAADDRARCVIAGVDVRRDPSAAKSPRRLLPRRRRSDPPGHRMGAPAAGGHACAGWTARGASGRQTCSSRFDLHSVADRITAELLPRHGPADVRRARRLPLPRRAAARRAVRRGRPARRRGDHAGHPRSSGCRDRAVLVSTHLLDLAVQACEEAIVLHRGAVVSRDAGGRAGGRGRRGALSGPARMITSARDEPALLIDQPA